MRGKDYWRMSERELEVLASKYNIPTTAVANPDSPIAQFYFNRKGVIEALVFRDNARRATWALRISILALIVSIAALTLSLIFKK
jgi:hypothetical protein